MKMPSKRSLLGIAWGAFAIIPLPSPLAGAHGMPVSDHKGRDGAAGLRRLPADFELPEAPDATQWKSPEEGRKETEQIEFSWVGETARHVGTVVHRWLQRMADDELNAWSPERITALNARFRRELQRRGVPSAEIGMAADLVSAALANALADERGRWLLGPHAEAWTEYRVRTSAGKRYVVDRRIRDNAGIHWVVDYKTSRHEGTSLEAFLDREVERYAPQLARYAQALGDARMGLYFPLLRGWREWENGD